jgi:hypothetical protein
MADHRGRERVERFAVQALITLDDDRLAGRSAGPVLVKAVDPPAPHRLVSVHVLGPPVDAGSVAATIGRDRRALKSPRPADAAKTLGHQRDRHSNGTVTDAGSGLRRLASSKKVAARYHTRPLTRPILRASGPVV